MSNYKIGSSVMAFATFNQQKCYICKTELSDFEYLDIKNMKKYTEFDEIAKVWLCRNHWCDCMKINLAPLSYVYRCGSCKKNTICRRCMEYSCETFVCSNCT